MTKPQFFLQFAGQGNRYLDELKRVFHSEPDLQDFILEAGRVIECEVVRCQRSSLSFYSYGFALEEWLTNGDKRPPAAYLHSSPISYPLTYLTQLANFLASLKGLSRESFLESCCGATGFSTGIMTALLVAAKLPEKVWRERALALQALFVWAGARVQKCTLAQGVEVELAAHSPSCMARVDGLSLARLEPYIAAVKNEARVEVAYILEEERIVIAAMPSELTTVQELLTKAAEDCSWQFILSSTAAHSSYHRLALEELLQDAVSCGFSLEANELAMPVYSIADGRDMRTSEDMLVTALRGFLLDRGDWPKQVEAAITNGVSHVVDYGPGAGIAGLTGRRIQGEKPTVIKCSIPLGRKLFAQQIEKSC